MPLMNALYYKLAAKGVVFPDVAADSARRQERTAAASNPNVAGNQQEADDLAKAIAESLRTQENETSAKSSPTNNPEMRTQTTANMYSLDALSDPQPIQETVQSAPATKEAKALYDFEAVEDNEVSFKAGHIILLFDTSHEAWWRGQNTATLREGLFPANFVEIQHASQTAAKTTAVEAEGAGDQEKSVQKLIVPLDLERVEETLNRLRVHDPGSDEPPMMKFNEKLCSEMSETVSNKVTLLDKKFGEISSLNEKLRDIMNSFQSPGHGPAAPQMQYGLPPQGMTPPQGLPQHPMMPPQPGMHPQMMGNHYQPMPPQPQYQPHPGNTVQMPPPQMHSQPYTQPPSEPFPQ